MKILNKENDINVLYIQKEDLLIIKEKFETVPDFIEEIITSKLNDNDFVKITSEGQIGYINLFKWIVDYKKYQNITTMDYNKLFQEYSRNISKIDQEIFLGRNANDSIVKKHIVTKQIKDIYAIYQHRYTNNKINLPFVIDYDKEAYKVNCNDNTYIIKQTLSNDTILIEKDNKEIINKNDVYRITISMFNAIINRKSNINKDYDDYNLSFNDNNTSAIITFIQNKKDNESSKVKQI